MQKQILLFALLFSLLFSSQSVKAELVTIPDPVFAEYLTQQYPSCMTGNQLETTCNSVLSAQYFTGFGGLNISDFTGIEHFVNIRSLSISYDEVGIENMVFPPNLENLWVSNCEFNIFFTLPEGLISFTAIQCPSLYIGFPNFLPSTLENLEIISCYAGSIPPLPAGLKFLDVTDNNLGGSGSLPELPEGLDSLNIGRNFFDGNDIPPLPQSLKSLSFSWNHAFMDFEFPVLPISLRNLRMANCEFDTLPDLSGITSLEYLNISGNNLTILPTLPSNLEDLQCSNNQLSVSNLAGLPDNLEILNCKFNDLSTLPSLPQTLTLLECSNNELTLLPPLPQSLTRLYCSNNELTLLPPLPQSLTRLYCSYNELTFLPPLPPVLRAFDVSNNPEIYCLPALETYLGFSGNFKINNTGITCLPNIIQHTYDIPIFETMPLCGIFGNGCEVAWNIGGDIRREDNDDCVSNDIEPKLSNVKLQLIQNGEVQQQVYSNAAGFYSFDTDLDSYSVRVDTTDIPFTVTCPSTGLYLSDITTSDSLDFDGNFGLKCKPGFDLGVSGIAHSGLFFPDNIANVRVRAGDMNSYYGQSCVGPGLGATVKASFDGPVTLNEIPEGATLINDTLTWMVDDVAELSPNFSFAFDLRTDTFPDEGAQVCIYSQIIPNSGTDNNLENDSRVNCFNVVNSYDPNIKEVYPPSIEQPGDWHTYTIHFQNTGTAAAQNILVIDTLDEKLNWDSFRRTISSHDNYTQVLSNGIVHFNFPSINLPDSTSDEPNSHGWIQFIIKTDSSLQAPDVVNNTAAIYFDFNDPIITNNAKLGFCTNTFVTNSYMICEGDSITIDGNTYSSATTISSVYPTVLGCDSTVSTRIEMFEPSEFQVTQHGENLIVSEGMQSYQWINCDNNEIIEGETNPEFTVTQNGSYAVQFISSDGCSGISECFEFLSVGIDLKDNSITTIIYPNPAKESFTIESDKTSLPINLKVFSSFGQVVLERQMNVSPETINEIQQLASGIYFIQLSDVKGRYLETKKLIISK